MKDKKRSHLKLVPATPTEPKPLAKRGSRKPALHTIKTSQTLIEPADECYECERYPEAIQLNKLAHFAIVQSGDTQDMASLLPQKTGDLVLLATPCCAHGYAMGKEQLAEYIEYLTRYHEKMQ